MCKLTCLEALSRTVWWFERVQAEAQGWEGVGWGGSETNWWWCQIMTNAPLAAALVRICEHTV